MPVPNLYRFMHTDVHVVISVLALTDSDALIALSRVCGRLGFLYDTNAWIQCYVPEE